MRRPKTVLWSVMTLVLALLLAQPVPVYAADVGLTKGVTPPTPNEYQLGETIRYVMSIINISETENITITAVWDVLPDGSTVYPPGPSVPYTLAPGQNQSYTYDWVANKAGRVVNTFHASGYQGSSSNDTFSLKVEKSSLVEGPAVGGTASLVDKLGLLAPWAGLLACAVIVTWLVLRKRRHA